MMSLDALSKLTLADLRALCDRYVPDESRHPGAFGPCRGEEWWHAHEIGHLLTVDPRGIGAPLFGLDQDVGELTPRRRHELICRERAAMSVSRRLLISAGRSDLVSKEEQATASETVHYNDRGRVRRILADHRCLRLPSTRAQLERKLQRITEAYRARRVA